MSARARLGEGQKRALDSHDLVERAHNCDPLLAGESRFGEREHELGKMVRYPREEGVACSAMRRVSTERVRRVEEPTSEQVNDERVLVGAMLECWVSSVHETDLRGLTGEGSARRKRDGRAGVKGTLSRYTQMASSS